MSQWEWENAHILSHDIGWGDAQVIASFHHECTKSVSLTDSLSFVMLAVRIGKPANEGGSGESVEMSGRAPLGTLPPMAADLGEDRMRLEGLPSGVPGTDFMSDWKGQPFSA